ncbi:MAG: hypothetical protein P8182_19170, partial [Deltaproteobacteria bacterium]
SGNDLIPRLEELYRRMDQAYAAIAAEVGFSCKGCDGERCCTVDLTLHTTVEKQYLRKGFKNLNISKQREILARCDTMLAAKEEDPSGDAYRNAVCVLNFDGLCILYPYRPMICRVAGIPHTILRPDGKTFSRGGCSRYQTLIQPAHPDLKMDRTEFYQEMAAIEISVIRASGQRTAPSTVAETIGREGTCHIPFEPA